ncbi:PKD domain-containing protein [Chitinophagaceae bacterium MMS25-I14]
MTKKILYLIVPLLFFLLPQSHARGYKRIDGPISVCKNALVDYTLAYSPAPPAGSTIQWSMETPVLGSFSSTTTYNTTVSWPQSGITKIHCKVYNSAGILLSDLAKQITVYDVPEPVIFTDYLIACQNFPRDKEIKDPFEDGQCVKVCAGSHAKYSLQGIIPSGSTFEWTVTGGTPVAGTTGNICEVVWDATPGMGSISVVVTGPGGCTGTKTGCIERVELPTADFYLPADPTAEDIKICRGQTVTFADHSAAGTGSAIISWLWDFGDNTTYASTTNINAQHQYNDPGDYTVSLTVTNACGCTNTVKKIHVSVAESPGLTITCPGVICDGERHSYRLEGGSCSDGKWEAIGGHILQEDPASVEVIWDDVDPSTGFGYLTYLPGNCDVECANPVTVKIPVILHEAKITGPGTICRDELKYKYSLPQWPTTDFKWHVVSVTGTADFYQTDQRNEISLQGHTNGTVILECDYTNTLLLCGGHASIEVTIQSPDTINGPKKVCLNSTDNFTLHSGQSVQWTLQPPSGMAITSIASTQFPPTGMASPFTQPGIYYLSVPEVPGHCSPEPLQIQCMPNVTAVDEISGPVKVCQGGVYQYTAYNPLPGTVFHWQILGNNASIVGSNYGNTASVQFINPGPYTISVTRELAESPFCAGPALTLNVSNIVVDPTISSILINNQGVSPANLPYNVCPNSANTFTCSYNDADSYTWSIIPAGAGSIDHNENQAVNITWHNANFNNTATVRVVVKRCNQTKTVDIPVLIRKGSGITGITTDKNTVCSGEAVTASLITGSPWTGGSVTWSAGSNATVAPTPGNPASASISVNNETGFDQTVTVTAEVNGFNSCGDVATFQTDITVRAKPVISTSPSGLASYCGSINIPVSATVGTTVSTLTWFQAPGTLLSTCNAPSFGCSTMNITAPGTYYATVTDIYGCTNTSDPVSPIEICPCDQPVGINLTASQSCGQIEASAFYAPGPDLSNPAWSISPNTVTTVLQNTTFNPATFSAVATQPGVYNITFNISKNNCTTPATQQVTVPVIPGITLTRKCNPLLNNYKITASSSSLTMPGVSFNYEFDLDLSNAWTAASPVSAHNFAVAAGSGTHHVRMRITCYINGVLQTCIAEADISIPALPSANFTPDPLNTICSDQSSVVFTPDQTLNGPANAPYTWTWNFGDGTSNTVSSSIPGGGITHTFHNTGATAVQTYGVSLTVKDAFGCTVNGGTQDVPVHTNQLNGTLSSNPVNMPVCPGTPVTLQFNSTGASSPASYQWMADNSQTGYPSANTYTVYSGGDYWVHVTDQYGCWYNSPHKTVDVSTVPQPVIVGRNTACKGDAFTLNSSLGNVASTPGNSIRWYRDNGLVYTGNNPVWEQDGNLSVGTHTFVAEVWVNGCSRASASFNVVVRALPASPDLTYSVTNCHPYEVTLTAAPNMTTGMYNWSNGAIGNPITVNTGGYYKVWYTDEYGCKSSASTYAPNDPAGYLWIFPEGCYHVCPPRTILGPIASFDHWEWGYNGGVLSSGSGTVNPITVLGSGDYNLTLGNGGCDATSGTMSISYDPKECNIPQCATLQFDELSMTGSGCNYTLNMVMPYQAPMPVSFTATCNEGSLVVSGGTIPQGPTYSFNTSWVPPYANYPGGYVVVTLTFLYNDGSVCTRTVTQTIAGCAPVDPCETAATVVDFWADPTPACGSPREIKLQFNCPTPTGYWSISTDPAGLGTFTTPSDGPLVAGFNTVLVYWLPPAASGQLDFIVNTAIVKGSAGCLRRFNGDYSCIPAEAYSRRIKAAATASNNLEVVPNPANANVSISYQLANPTASHTIAVYDVTGRKITAHVISETDNGQWQLNLSNFANGVYQVSLMREGAIISTARMVVAH